MPLSKNQIMEMEIAGLSSDGNGVGRAEGMAVFVPGTAPGDRLRVRIVKVLSRYAFGRVEEVLTPGPGRVAPDCPAFGPCGGCALRQLDYAAECEAKTGFVRDAFSRLGGLSVAVSPVVPAPAPDRYRNKVQLPVGRDANGRIVTGFYAGRSHRIVPCQDCQLQPEWMNALAARACALFEQFGIEPYDEEQHTGLVRHLYLRQGWHSGQRLLCFVLNGKALPHEKAICAALQQEFGLTTMLVNENTARTNVILGENTRTVLGPGVIEDTLAGVPLRMGVHEFYQVNTPAAEALYAKARELAGCAPAISCWICTAAWGASGFRCRRTAASWWAWRWCPRPWRRPARPPRGWACPTARRSFIAWTPAQPPPALPPRAAAPTWWWWTRRARAAAPRRWRPLCRWRRAPS